MNEELPDVNSKKAPRCGMVFARTGGQKRRTTIEKDDHEKQRRFSPTHSRKALRANITKHEVMKVTGNS